MDPILLGIIALVVVGGALFFKKHPDVAAQVQAALAPELVKLKGQMTNAVTQVEAAAKKAIVPTAVPIVASDTTPNSVVVGAVAVSAPTPSSPTAPTVQRIGGVAVASSIPINPAWAPSQEDLIYGGAFGGAERALTDPSNTPDPAKWPARSPAGYPLFYALMPGPNGGTIPAPGMPACPLYRGQTFPDDASIAKFIAEEPGRLATYAARDTQTAIDFATLQPGQWDLHQATLADLLFVNANFATLMAKVGPTGLLNQCVNWVNGQAAKPPIPGLADIDADIGLDRLTFNQAAYTGPLRALL